MILSVVDGQIIADVSKDISAVQEGFLGLMGSEGEGKKEFPSKSRSVFTSRRG